MLTFISGGARSGKSRLAEQLAADAAGDRKPFYMATARKSEMPKRISIHQLDRGNMWITIEEPLHIDLAAGNLPDSAVVLIDCLTVWTSNVMFSEHLSIEETAARFNNLLSISKRKNLNLYLVSNDVNEGIPLKNKGIDHYIQCLESVHKLAVLAADDVYEVLCGLPVVWKKDGQYPEGIWGGNNQ
ncbi:bifunctional adenosylcobinamide kinase/adenosylcobinamide-phosphate guanylyltransferase [Metabacillus sp. JX24]|uniref:bifunctional adenosylcobinamide kinase/adenosylcobinamide-phosphate guanylyltransferase n=1 Tax=Metabacillus sp. JX24 TaxID=3240759 RepID=UPI00350F1B57